MVVNVVVAHTADLAPATLTAVRALLDTAFDNGFGDADWDHSLGGMHAMAWDGDELVGHAAVVQRRLLHQGRALRAGYVEGVAVRADRRRRGIGAAVMAPVERIIRGAYELGALGSSEMGVPFYLARGWRRWQGRTWALTPNGITRTPDDDDGVYVLPVRPVELTADLTCDWRAGDVW
ncbi:GNAT family N-acetyltransferase [Actinophytocola sp.]|uniref:GNAT family N-acetyltransferase n=1 Tax=Actinophytocola sp. TaxID=1872138 RepID=UPI0039C86C84